MPTTHTWNPNTTSSDNFIFNPANYVDGTAFVPGDALVVNAGYPGVQTVPGTASYTLLTGTFVFNDTGGANEHLDLNDVRLDGASTLAETGPQQLNWYARNQFFNDGLVQVGSATAAGSVYYDELTTALTQQSQLTNNGTIQVQNGSVFNADSSVSGSTLLNNPGGVVSVSSGSLLNWGAYYGATNAGIVNNGSIVVQGAAGRKTGINVGGNLSGSGTLSVKGAPGAAPSDTTATIYGASSGTLDVASGDLEFYADPTAGSINVLDNDGRVVVHSGPGVSSPPNPFGATIYGFQPGDSIYLDDQFSIAGYSYDPSTHLLSLNASNGTHEAQFTIAGSYTSSDFHVATDPTGVGPVTITTTSAVQAIPGFAHQDTATNAVATDPGQQYTGPVDYLQSQYIWAGQDSVNVTAHLPNVFLKGGPGSDALAANSGSNVLDGNTGSNFLVGASGADGGTDTFFLDGSVGTTWDTIANFHPGDSVTLWGYVPSQSVMSWAANDGTAGYTGATIHAAFAGAGTPVNGSVTFAGVSLADAQSKFTTSSGAEGGRNYLYIHYNG